MEKLNIFNGDEINQRTILGHPSGLFTLFFTEMWERFSYYGMRAILVLFLISSLDNQGWGWDRKDALVLYAWYTGLVYITPIFGGLLADKFLGYRKAVVIGALLMTLGHAAMALEVFYDFYLYVGLSLLIIGNGFFKPNISSIVGQMYKDEGKIKDAAYTIFYMGINSGAFLGILLCGYIGETVNWHYGFGLAGIFMLFGMLQFHFGQKIFGDIGLSKNKTKKEINEQTESKVSLKVTTERLIVIGIFSFVTIFFWWGFEQAGGSMTIFANDYTNRDLAGTGALIFKIVNSLLTIVPMIIITIILAVAFSIFSNQIAKQNNLKAASIYSSFLEEISSSEPDNSELNGILDNLLMNYKNTGYTQIALLNKASLDARNNNFDESLKNFEILVDLTDGFNGNKIYNKIARVSAARILLSNDKYDEALNMIEKFSSNSTNGYIHELSGDILFKQNKIDLAISQYELASSKYNDETSKSIISMKISNIGT